MPTPYLGVNLGGWLVLERWITPRLFAHTDAHDEYSFCAHATASDNARLKAFRDTFVTKADFAQLAAQGVQAVRLPVGYWMFGDAPPYQPTVQYVDAAFRWAATYHLRILISIHGVPGSQNGSDHSGQQGTTGWHTTPANQAATLAFVEKLAARYGHHSALLGISLLNEPSLAIPRSALMAYYRAAYTIVRTHCANDTWVVISDSFRPFAWRTALTGREYHHTYMDVHHYQLFTARDQWLPFWAQYLRARVWLPAKLRLLRAYRPIIVGEWSAALPAQRTRSTTRMCRYYMAQARALRHSSAQFFWTYKTESPDGWNFAHIHAQCNTTKR